MNRYTFNTLIALLAFTVGASHAQNPDICVDDDGCVRVTVVFPADAKGSRRQIESSRDEGNWQEAHEHLTLESVASVDERGRILIAVFKDSRKVEDHRERFYRMRTFDPDPDGEKTPDDAADLRELTFGDEGLPPVGSLPVAAINCKNIASYHQYLSDTIKIRERADGIAIRTRAWWDFDADFRFHFRCLQQLYETYGTRARTLFGQISTLEAEIAMITAAESAAVDEYIFGQGTAAGHPKFRRMIFEIICLGRSGAYWENALRGGKWSRGNALRGCHVASNRARGDSFGIVAEAFTDRLRRDLQQGLRRGETWEAVVNAAAESFADHVRGGEPISEADKNELVKDAKQWAECYKQLLEMIQLRRLAFLCGIEVAPGDYESKTEVNTALRANGLSAGQLAEIEHVIDILFRGRDALSDAEQAEIDALKDDDAITDATPRRVAIREKIDELEAELEALREEFHRAADGKHANSVNEANNERLILGGFKTWLENEGVFPRVSADLAVTCRVLTAMLYDPKHNSDADMTRYLLATLRHYCPDADSATIEREIVFARWGLGFVEPEERRQGFVACANELEDRYKELERRHREMSNGAHLQIGTEPEHAAANQLKAELEQLRDDAVAWIEEFLEWAGGVELPDGFDLESASSPLSRADAVIGKLSGFDGLLRKFRE